MKPSKAFQMTTSMADVVFCCQNCSDLLWEKIVTSDLEKNLKFEAEIFLTSLEQFIQTAKGW